MPRKPSKTLTEAELRVMEVLWEQGESTVKDVTAALENDQQPAYNTVLTMLRILHQKGYVDFRKQGRAHVYAPLVDRRQARRSVLDYLLNRFFNDSPALLVQNLLENEDLDQRTLDSLKKRIAREDEEGKFNVQL